MLSGTPIEEIRAKVLDVLAENNKPLAGLANVKVGDDMALSGLRPAISDALCLRAGTSLKEPHERSGEFRRLSCVEMGRRYLSAIGVVGSENLGAVEVTGLLLAPDKLRMEHGAAFSLAQSVGDFDYVLQDAMGKTLRMAYEDTPTTWPLWARRAFAPDFKDVKRVALSEAPNMVARSEGQEIKYVTLSDSREVYALVEYIQGISLTRKAFINDDMDAFGRILVVV